MATYKFSKDLCASIEKLGSTRKSSEKLVEELNGLHDAILEEQKFTLAGENAEQDKNQEYRLDAGDHSKLKDLYKKSVKQFEEEENMLLLILSRIQDMIDKAEEKKTQKPIKKPAAPPPPIQQPAAPPSNVVKPEQVTSEPTATIPPSTSQPNQPTAARPAGPQSSRAYLQGTESEIDNLKPKDKVAARVSLENDNEDEDFWILASVVKYLGKDRIEVEDEDASDDDPSRRKHYRLNKKHIIPLSKDYNAHKPFKKGQEVLAMFPDTTTFYKAIVDTPPNMKAGGKDYTLRFDDDKDERGRLTTRKVNFAFVIRYPGQHSKNQV